MASFNIPLPLDLNEILRRNSKVILSESAPPAPQGKENVAWQTDEYGNLSAHQTTVPVYRATVPISSEQLLGMYDTPVFLVGPPDGYDITMVSPIVRFYPGPTNTPYTFDNPNEIVLIGLGGPDATQADLYNGDFYSMSATGFVDQTVINNNAIWVPTNAQGSLEPEGSAFWLTTGQGSLLGGDGTLIVYLNYTIA